MTNRSPQLSSLTTTVQPQIELDSEHQLHLGFERMKEEIEAVSVDEIEVPNISVRGAVQTILGTIPEVLALRAELAKLGGFDMDHVDKLRDRALALGHTHNMHRIAIGAPSTEVVRELFATRARLHADAQPLVQRGLLDPLRVAALQSGNNHQGLAYDVIGLVELILEIWPQIEGRVLLEMEDLERARLLGNRLLHDLSAKEQGPGVNAATTLLRQKAFTLAVRSYNEVRDAIMWVRRRQGDVDRITPSLYAGRGKRPTRDEKLDPPNQTETSDAVDSLESELTATEGLNSAVAKAFAAPNPNHSDPSPAASNVPVGFPGAPPLGKE